MASRVLQEARKSAVRLTRTQSRASLARNVPYVTRSFRSLGTCTSTNGTSTSVYELQQLYASRFYSTKASSDGAGIVRQNKETLERVREFIEQAGSVNSKNEKVKLIRTYTDIREILINIYAPHSKHHLTSKSLLNYLEGKPSDNSPSELSAVPLSALLSDLRERVLTGNAARDACGAWLRTTTGSSSEATQSDRITLQETFLRILDRNLQAGVGYKLICDACADEELVGVFVWPKETVEKNEHLPKQRQGKTQQSQQEEAVLEPPKAFGVALGKSVSEKDLPKLLAKGDWYSSRKLDGVRCVLFADFEGVDAGDARVVSLRAFTRSGKELRTLEVLLSSLRPHLASAPTIAAMLKNEASRVDSTTHRIVLDGEVVVAQLAVDAVSGVKDEQFKEDFALLARSILRQSFSSAATRAAITRGVENPLYFPFDLLPWRQFDDWRKHPSEDLSVRLAKVDELATWMEERGTKVRRLEQHLTKEPTEVMQFMQQGIEQGWEGLVLRLDRTYEGKRSAAVRKFKQWHDAEYVVESVDVTEMRLPVDTKFEIRKALGNAWIRHKGTPVSIGSGFTVAERLRYGAAPEELIGKQVTVEYFGESKAIKRGDDEALSLRFPRVKKVWEGAEGRNL